MSVVNKQLSFLLSFGGTTPVKHRQSKHQHLFEVVCSLRILIQNIMITAMESVSI